MAEAKLKRDETAEKASSIDKDLFLIHISKQRFYEIFLPTRFLSDVESSNLNL